MVYLAETTWSLNREIKENPQITFKFISKNQIKTVDH